MALSWPECVHCAFMSLRHHSRIKSYKVGHILVHSYNAHLRLL